MIIDTSVWIPAYKDHASAERTEVARLVRDGEAAIVGIVLTEVLRGARNSREFDEMSDELLGAEFVEDAFEDWILAARILADLQRGGQVIPLQDALIASQALGGGHAVYTADSHFSRVPGLRLHVINQNGN